MNQTSYQVTENQAIALRKFGVSEAKIQGLTKPQASDLLTQFIERIESKKNGRPAQNGGEAAPLTEASTNLADATKVVMDHFGLRDKSKLSEVYVALIQETSRQIYGLKYWIGKSNTRFD